MRVAALLAILSAALTVSAQRDTTISIVTIYPGAEIYELEGHTVLRMRYNGQDLAVNYGLFDFDAPNFVYRFVKGETDYTMDICPWPLLQMYYQQQGRRIVERVFNLTPKQKSEIIHAVGVNYLPGNRVYRYNYVLDNCATRAFGIIEKVLPDSVTFGNPDDRVADAHTWRQAMSVYHCNYPWYQLGIDIALGSGIDVPIEARGHIYAPVGLDTRLSAATAGDHKLVTTTNILNDVAEDNAVLPPTPWYLTPWAVFALVLICVTIITVRDWRRRRPTRWVDTVLFGIVGTGGCVLTFLIFVSTHYATSPNWLYLWINPLSLVIAVNVWIKGAEKLVYWLQLTNFALILGGLAAWPLTGQSTNPALILPAAACLLRSGLYIVLYQQQRRNDRQK